MGTSKNRRFGVGRYEKPPSCTGLKPETTMKGRFFDLP